MKKEFFLFFFLATYLLFAQREKTVTFSEVMFYPEEANGEFVELYNCSEDSSIDLSKFTIIYYTSTADTIVKLNTSTLLRPKSYAIIFENDYDFLKGEYSKLLPDSALVLTIDNGKFGSSGMANTSDRTIYLLDESTDTLDVYKYSAKNSKGISDEKINQCGDNSERNWENSLQINGTPGYRNSVSQRDFDLELSDVDFSPSEIFCKDEVIFNIKVKNIGLKTAENFNVSLFADFNSDSLAEDSEIILDENYINLVAGDSVDFSVQYIFSENGLFNIYAEVLFDDDEVEENNYMVLPLLVKPTPNAFADIVINEIMFNPEGDEPEWIELFNRSESPINLKDWRFADRTSKPVIADSLLFIEGNDFLVLTEEESLMEFYLQRMNVKVMNLPSLNNKGDDLKLIDSLGQIIDSVNYLSDWGKENGFSLEKISVNSDGNDSTNWGACIGKNKGTPGKINSITPKEFDLSISKIELENRYGVVGENLRTLITIKNIGLNDVLSFTLLFGRNISNDNKDVFDSVAVGFLAVGDSTQINYSLNNFEEGENRFFAKINLDGDAEEENNKLSFSFVGVILNEMRNDIVINEIMYSPVAPESEWIEIYNRSSKTINLKNYKIADAKDTSRIIDSEQILKSNSYFVIADDSGFVGLHESVSDFIVSSFPNLNNSGDRIILLDSLNRVIDSLNYNSDFGGSSGKTLERIDVDLPSTDSSNWSSSKEVNGTPCKVNSISQKNYDVEISSVVFTPNIPKLNTDVKISAFVKNIGKMKADFSLKLFEIFPPDTLTRNELETSSSLTLSPIDSIQYQFDFEIRNLSEERTFEVKVSNFDDQDSLNNVVSATIAPSFKPLSIVINEIMYSPANGEAEWIEFLNVTDFPLDIKGFTIEDVFTTPKITTVSEEKLIVNPHEYLVISKDSLLSDFHKTIPSNTIVTNFANLNNDIDGVVLRDRFGLTIDSVEYKSTWGGLNGFSLERILPQYSSIDSATWKSSLDIEQSTPGRKNSVTPFQFDLEINKISSLPLKPKINSTVKIFASIKNSGLNLIENSTILFYAYIANNSFLLDSLSIQSLAKSDSVDIISTKSFSLSDTTIIKCEIVCTVDQFLQNNVASDTIYPGSLKGTVLINEFMANPSIGEAEWVEIYNPGESPQNISSWYIKDLSPTTSMKPIGDRNFILNPNEYLVLTNDSSKYKKADNERIVEVKFGNLGNDEDGIILFDFNGDMIDSLYYNRDWQIKKGRSLERYSDSDETTEISNWLPSLSISGSTPGKPNSILSTMPAEQNSVVINEIMFNPENTNSDYVEIFNPTEKSIDIGGWAIVDGGGNITEISSTFFELHPNDFFLVCNDSSIFNNYDLFDSSVTIASINLSSTGESLVLIDHWGNCIDSVEYNTKWHNGNILSTKNKSLERISPLIDGNIESNWSTSVSEFGGTPLKVNSIHTENINRKDGITFSPNPFSPDGDSFEDFSIINYSLPFATAQIRVKIFDDKGRIVRTLANNIAGSGEGSIIFDGLNDDGNPLPIGMYIVLLEASNTKKNESVLFKDVIVIARKL